MTPPFQTEHLSATLRAYANPISASFGATGLEISSSNLTFHLSLVDINSLKPHEEVMGPLVESLADSMRTQGIVRDPLIVDQDKYVILDGMHRFSSMKVLKCRFAPCCLVDYDNPLIKVGSWFRLFALEESESFARNLLTENNLSYVEEKANLDQTSANSHAIIFTKSGIRYSLPQVCDPIELTRTAAKLEKAITMRGHHVDYLSETVTFQNLRSGNVDLVIVVPIFTKQQIGEFGLRGLLLPHKVTRHVMPSRPLRIDIPLNMLRAQNTSQAEADREFRELLSSRDVQRKPPGSVVDGRRYEEELLVFAT
jgi:hypothetical protein